MIQINIEPIDTLFFRDARSFSAGIDTVAEFEFPSPLTFFGAIGTAVLDNTGSTDLKDFVNKEHPKLGKYDSELKNTIMKLKGPFLHKEDETFFPPPANLWVHGEKPYTCYVSKPYKTGWKWDIKKEHIRPLKMPSIEKIKPIDEYISASVLAQYLSNSLPQALPSSTKPEEDFFLREIRYGHAISKKSLTVCKGYLYTSTHLRFEGKKCVKNGFTLIAEGIDELDISNKTIFLGGDRRKAMITVCNANKLIPAQPEVLKKIQSAKRFFIYLTTPAIFTNGWYKDLPKEFNDAVMVGAAVNKPLYISGWKKSGKGFGGEPRPIRKAVPAGSVYFFEAESWDDGKFETFYKEYHFGESLSDEYPSAGFGIGLIGSW